jgi:hypothetical protein
VLNVDPNRTRSKTLSSEPSLVIPYVLTLLPRRANERKLIDDPSEQKSSIDIEDASRQIPKRDTELPRRIMLRSARDEPKFV